VHFYLARVPVIVRVSPLSAPRYCARVPVVRPRVPVVRPRYCARVPVVPLLRCPPACVVPCLLRCPLLFLLPVALSPVVPVCATAHRHNLDVYAYVKEVADQLLTGNRDYKSMQPENWAKTHPHHVRIYRQEEARYKADREAKRLHERRRELKKQSKGNS
jgi:hypothetical protein